MPEVPGRSLPKGLGKSVPNEFSNEPVIERPVRDLALANANRHRPHSVDDPVLILYLQGSATVTVQGWCLIGWDDDPLGISVLDVYVEAAFTQHLLVPCEEWAVASSGMIGGGASHRLTPTCTSR